MSAPAENWPADPEEAARADVYGVLSALFYAPPNPELLTDLRAAPPAREGGTSELETAWQNLAQIARAMDSPDIADEYAWLFGGVGKPDVYLYGSHYLAGFLNEKPLVRLREDLGRLGLARDEAMSESEDHFAFLCEVMRQLIVDIDAPGTDLSNQRLVFEKHVAPWADAMCAAIEQHPKARFYACAAALARAFVTVERQAFEMLEAPGEDR